jgi:hypothetical protein
VRSPRSVVRPWQDRRAPPSGTASAGRGVTLDTGANSWHSPRPMNQELWLTWINSALTAVDADARIRVPAWLPPPEDSGFTRPWIAEPHGQIADYILALSDGTRVHVHEMQDGRLLAHRERNPSHSFASALMHFFTESFTGRALLIGAGISLLVDGTTPRRRGRS